MEEQLGPEGRAPIAMLRKWMSQLDPPDHTPIRSAFAATFTPRAIQDFDPIIEAVVADAMTAIQGADQPVDLMPSLAYEVPILVICEILGVPGGDRAAFKRWSSDLVRLFEPGVSAEPLLECGRAVEEFSAYLSDLIDDRQCAPRNDITTKLVLDNLNFRSESGRQALIANLMLLVWAGHETTMNLIGNGLLAFARNPRAVEALVNEPDLMPNAVEEVLRYEGPIRTTSRIAHEPVVVGDMQISPGDMVVVLQQAANGDPLVFADGDRFDVRRENARSHLGFGGGIHFCLGASLARAEASVVFREYFRRFGVPRVVDETPDWNRSLFIRGLNSLGVVL
ncbi:cytochrome P450 [Nocardia sp. CDC160]|uniref:cytochrome P450 n=1 Tax=Nocardia sp. CDC160 TaxID=3112166 RepID=UPI002DBF6E5C|nr:cytochrome P450 [Nocardia sp. CDC160]MEC3919193.1 cytochrome P450 [Nocardia sp. CDC160]